METRSALCKTHQFTKKSFTSGRCSACSGQAIGGFKCYECGIFVHKKCRTSPQIFPEYQPQFVIPDPLRPGAIIDRDISLKLEAYEQEKAEFLKGKPDTLEYFKPLFAPISVEGEPEEWKEIAKHLSLRLGKLEYLEF